MATWADVITVVAELPGTEQGTSYGKRAWRVGKTLLVWERSLRGTERRALGPGAPSGELVALSVAHVEDRGELLTALPEIFFTTPHLAGHAIVLARLEPLPVDVLRDLVHQAWLRSASPELVQRRHDAGG
jgi:hypothetical protein